MLRLITAMADRNGAIGNNNRLLWRQLDDMKFFTEMTRGSAVIMGCNTYGSLVAPLPNRLNIILTRTPPTTSQPDNVVFTDSIDEAIRLGREYSDDTYVIGGGQIYRLFIDLVDSIYLTEIYMGLDRSKADTHFPVDLLKDWAVDKILGAGPADDRNDYPYRILELVKSTGEPTVEHAWRFKRVLLGNYSKTTCRTKISREDGIILFHPATNVPFNRLKVYLPSNANTFSIELIKSKLAYTELTDFTLGDITLENLRNRIDIIIDADPDRAKVVKDRFLKALQLALLSKKSSIV